MYRGIELKGKTVGIIGLGRIGTAIADACEGLGMQVKYWSRSYDDSYYEYVDLDTLLKSSDVIFPRMDRNDMSQVILANGKLDQLKPSAILISLVRGLLDGDHVLEMIKNNKLFGYGFEAEPMSFEKYEGNVWAAPAHAWATYESMHNSMIEWTNAMISASKDEYPTRVN